MRTSIVIALALAIPMSAVAQDSPYPGPMPMPLEEQEKVEGLEKALSAIDKMKAIGDELVTIKTNQCMKAIGNASFCDCVVNKSPMFIDFIQYVSILSQTKEDLKYDALSADDKKVVDGARRARDACVQWQGKSAPVVDAKKPR